MSNRKALQTPEHRFFGEPRRLTAHKPIRGFWEWVFGGYYRGS